MCQRVRTRYRSVREGDLSDIVMSQDADTFMVSFLCSFVLLLPVSGFFHHLSFLFCLSLGVV